MKHCAFQCCVLGFIVSWTTYGFTLWMDPANNCGDLDRTKNIALLFFIWLCITVPLAFLCLGCCALYMVCGTLACCTNNSQTEDEEKWRQENEALVGTKTVE